MAVSLSPPRRRGVAHRFSRNPRALLGALVLVLLAAIALAASTVAPYTPDVANFDHRLVPPGAAHAFGTDHLGRDVLSRTIWASRTSLTIGFLSAAIAVTLGVLDTSENGRTRCSCG